MSITIADVAARAGVSKTTVSRVLNGKGELDMRTAERVRQVIAELGYVPSARAVGLARGRTRIVGMLVPSLTWPWMGEVLQGAVDVVESEGYGLLLFTCNRGEESMQQFASQVSAQSFDGLLVIEPEGTLAYIEQLHSRGLPVVLIDDRAKQPLFPSVATTNRAGAAAAQHLLELGLHRPLVITGVDWFGCTQERLDGFRDTYAAAGIELDPRLVFEGDFTHESGRKGVQYALEAGLPFDSIFAHNDLSMRRCHPGRPGDRPERAERRVGGRVRRHPLRPAHRTAADHGASADAPDGSGGGPDADGLLRRPAAARGAQSAADDVDRPQFNRPRDRPPPGSAEVLRPRRRGGCPCLAAA